MTLQDPNSRSLRSASQIHLSTEQKTAFVISYSNVWVVRSIIRFDGARWSYALVRSNCNKLVIHFQSYMPILGTDDCINVLYISREPPNRSNVTVF